MAAKYSEMKWNNGNNAEEFKLFKQRLQLCLKDNGVTDQEKIANKIQIYVGTEGLKRINDSGLSEEDKKDPDKLWSLFEEQLKITVNFRIHRLEFMRYKLKPGEKIDEFVSRCRAKAKECDFTTDELAERVIELVINSTPHAAYQKELLEKEKGYPIDTLIKDGRRFEALAEGGQRMRNIDRPSIGVDGIQQHRECNNCGLRHAPRRCPAYRDICKKCGKTGHWQKKCRQGRQQRRGNNEQTNRRRSASRRGRGRGRSHGRQDHGRQDHGRQDHGRQDYGRQDRRRSPTPGRGRKHSDKSVDYVSETSHEDDQEADSVEFYSITVSNICTTEDNGKGVHCTLDVVLPRKQGQHKLRLKADSGAEGNTLPIRILKRMYPNTWEKVIQPTNSTLTAYNGTAIPCIGFVDIACHYHEQWSTHPFYVVTTNGPAVMGWPALKSLNVMSINGINTSPAVDDLMRRYPDRFDSIGSFRGEARIHLKDDAKPHIDAPRKCSVHIKPKLKAELQKMEEMGIIKPVHEHSEWCSSITTVLKKDGSIRVCLDPKRLNQAVSRCPHKIPTLEELTPELTHAKYFSKLDAKAGYWSVHLEESSQKLTTFRTPFGRYCYTRLPFGLNISQDIFQQHMDRILERAPGCIGIADDVAVYGSTVEEHDKNLENLMKIAREEGLVFNSKKCVIRQEQIEFFGSIYSSSGIRPDPDKVEDIKSMPTPQDKEDLQRFLGLITYLSAFIPNLADRAKPLRDLLKKDTPFDWHEDHQATLDNLKQSVSANACLQYFDPAKPTTVEVDASQKGLGACLVQDGKPVAFASKSLTTAQSNYANIERETLAVVFGVTRFHTYLFGRQFNLETDHKPLEMIWRKPLGSAPPRLQRLLVKLQGYDMDVAYKPGSTMVIADALSRLPNPHKADEVPLDVGVDGINLDDIETLLEDLESHDEMNIDLVNFGARKQEQLKTETGRDPILRAVKQVIQEGWPDKITELPSDIRPFWSFRDELGISDGALFKGRQVVIPAALREDILSQLHYGHLGIEKIRRLARDSVYWPGINKDIERTVKSCETCQEAQPSQHHEPLKPHDIPTAPWNKLATDLFSLHNEDYLVITDFHSKFPILYKLQNTKSETVAATTSSMFGIFGPPKEIVSDNGTQYSGRPFQQMCEKWGITHTTSSPHYPRSNGLAERTVRTVKSLLKKCKKTNQDIHLALLNLRATPVDHKLPSPAEMLLGRPVRTLLPSFHHADTLHTSDATNQQLQDRAARMKEDHDKKAGQDLPPLYVGQKVRIQNADKSWEPAEVSKVCDEPRSYIVSTPNGSSLRRNRFHIREMPSNIASTGKKDKVKPRHITFADDVCLPESSKPQEEPVVQEGKNDKDSKDETRPQPKQQKTTRSGRVVQKPNRYGRWE